MSLDWILPFKIGSQHVCVLMGVMQQRDNAGCVCLRSRRELLGFKNCSFQGVTVGISNS